MQYINDTELSSHEGTRCQFNGGTGAIKLGIDVHQDFYVVVEQVGGSNPKPPQRFQKQAFLHWAAKLKSQATEVYAVYEACGFGFALQRQLSALSIQCYVVCPQKLDEQNRRVKTDGLDAKALCLKLDRFVQGNRDALAIVRVPSEEEEQARAPFTGSANSWSKRANNWKPRDAVSWSITAWSRCTTGGSRALLRRCQCPNG